MTKFTKERIEQFIKSTLEHGLTRSEQMEMARQLLAGLEQEPVADVVAWHHPTEERNCDIRLRRHDLAPGPLYAAPQLPQPAAVVSDEVIDTFEAEFRRAFEVSAGVEQLIEIGYQGEKFSLSIRDAATWWKLGRAAILKHSAPFIVTSDHRMMEMPKAEDIDAVAAMLQGAEPVQGWIPCSERMPTENDIVLVVDDGYFVCEAQYREGDFFSAVRGKGEFFEGTCRDVELWMPLPAAPQQEVDNG